MAMKDEMFAELLESVEEAGRIMRGEAEPSRRFVVGSQQGGYEHESPGNVQTSQHSDGD